MITISYNLTEPAAISPSPELVMQLKRPSARLDNVIIFCIQPLVPAVFFCEIDRKYVKTSPVRDAW